MSIEKYLNEGERLVLTTRTHPKALFLPLLLVAVVLALGGWFVSVGGVMGWVGWALVAVAVLWFLLGPFATWWTTTYTFTDRRFFKRSGLVAKEGRTIPLNRISGVDFEIDLLDRLFGCGTLVVSDASQGGQVLLKDIPRVEQAQMTVADEIHRRNRADDGA